MKRFEFLVRVEVPDEATETEVRDYVSGWVSCGRGALRPPGAYGDDDPGDPLCDLELKSVTNAARAKAHKAPVEPYTVAAEVSLDGDLLRMLGAYHLFFYELAKHGIVSPDHLNVTVPDDVPCPFAAPGSYNLGQGMDEVQLTFGVGGGRA